MADQTWKRRKTGCSSYEVHLAVHAPEFVEVGVGGDVVVEAGKKTISRTQLIKVHSLCLKLASPVFRAMLESSFVEGTTKHTMDKPLELPDDHGPAFLEMCKVLHHQPPQYPQLSLLPHLAIIADKYQCVDSVRPYLLSTVGPFFGKNVTEGNNYVSARGLDCVTAMCIAYIIRDAQLFYRTSGSVLFTASSAEIQMQSRAFRGILPTNLIDRILEYRKQLRMELVVDLAKPENKVLSRCRPCEGQLKAVGHYRQQLHQSGMMKPPLPNRSLMDEWAAVNKIARLHAVPVPVGVKIKDVSCCRKCKTCPIDLEYEIEEVVSDSKESVQPLCLTCEGQKTPPPKLGLRCEHKFSR